MNHNDRINLIRRISELEGLTDHERSALLGLLRESKTYGLVWEDKPEAVEERMQEELPVLREVSERAIVSDSKDAPNHILIEGDNLEALTTLAYTHAGRIDVIYIDPPYNTGNKDFVYNDSFVDREDTYRHSKWLSFMSRRLKIAKQLLAKNGVLFISIGDDEVAQLKMLGEEYFETIALVPRIAKKGSNQGTHFRPTKDYILVFANFKDTVEPFRQPTTYINKKTFKLSEPNTGKKFRKGHSLYQASLDPLRGCVNQRYYIKAPDGTLIIPPGHTFPTIASDGERIPPRTKEDKVWRWSQSSYLAKKHLLLFCKSKRSPLVDNNNVHTDWNVYEKKYETEEVGDVANSLPNDFISDYTNSLGTSLLNDMQISFPFSKPIELIEYLISITNKHKSIRILDFFAGSGTTLHATMQLNAEDGGHRQCILVTNNENGICENVTYERNKRVIQGYTTPKGEQVAGLTDNSLRYYKTDFVPREPNNRNKRALVAAATDLLCIKNDVYQEQSIFGGHKLKPAAARYFDDGRTQMLIIYNELAVDAFVRVIAGMEAGGRIKVYVFSNNRYAYADNFEPVADKVEVCALPAAIYDAYQKVLKPRKRNGNPPAADTPFAEETTETTQGTHNFKEEEEGEA